MTTTEYIIAGTTVKLSEWDIGNILAALEICRDNKESCDADDVRIYNDLIDRLSSLI